MVKSVESTGSSVMFLLKWILLEAQPHIIKQLFLHVKFRIVEMACQIF